jgi:hypothetical protein
MPAGIVLVIGEFHKAEVDAIRDEVVKTAQECGMDVDTVVWIPGSMKAPLAAKRLLTYRVATRVHEARRNGDSRAGNLPEPDFLKGSDRMPGRRPWRLLGVIDLEHLFIGSTTSRFRQWYKKKSPGATCRQRWIPLSKQTQRTHCGIR